MLKECLHTLRSLFCAASSGPRRPFVSRNAVQEANEIMRRPADPTEARLQAMANRQKRIISVETVRAANDRIIHGAESTVAKAGRLAMQNCSHLVTIDDVDLPPSSGAPEPF